MVVVDEAALVTVDQVNALIELVADSGAALRLVGDPRQLGAVGRGGVMESAARWAGETVELDEVHRFLRRELNESGLAVVGEDVAYAELSLRLREGAEPDQLIDELVRRGAVVVHHSRTEAIAAMATEVASRAASPDALAVTVAKNEDAADLNEAVRRRRLEAGAVEDTVTAAGMDGVAIGAGEIIVTRRNDTARGVTNRERFVVQAITDDGTVLARSIGKGDARHVSLDGSYLAEAVQLGYVATDYGNQGVTSDASLTFVGEVTSTGGLYVGATRGCFENLVHIVAEDEEYARAKLVAALERDRADRGLDVARARAEADSVAVSSPPVGPSAAEGRGLRMDLASWRSAAELDRAERAIEVALARGLGFLRDLPHVSDEDRERENDVDRQAAAPARRQAAWHRGEVERLEASRGEVVEEATADYFAARKDARIIAAGPGRFHRRAARLEAAVAHRGDVARHWVEPSPPGAQWSDDAVRHQALQGVGRILGPVVREHLAEAEKGRDECRRLRRQDRAARALPRAAVRLNDHNTERRQELIAKAECERAAIAGARAALDELAADLTPEDVVAADAAHDSRTPRTGAEILRGFPLRRPTPAAALRSP